MKLRSWRQTLSFLVCCVLIAATALLTTGCDGSKQTSDTSASATPSATVTDAADAAPSQSDDHELGQGKTTFTFTVVDGEGQETAFQIHTDKTTVGDALVELGLIDRIGGLSDALECLHQMIAERKSSAAASP